jgi:hypothetical protein
VDHLLFQCPVARVVWGTLAICFNQSDRPSSYEHFFTWIKKALPGGERVYIVGLAAFCWAIWNARNKRCFEKICIKSPHEITISVCMFVCYWTGLFLGGDQELIKAGAAIVVQTSVNLMKKA